MNMSIFTIDGPNPNFLGTHESAIHGSESLQDAEATTKSFALSFPVQPGRRHHRPHRAVAGFGPQGDGQRHTDRIYHVFWSFDTYSRRFEGCAVSSEYWMLLSFSIWGTYESELTVLQ
jgi:hypothetical protein